MTTEKTVGQTAIAEYSETAAALADLRARHQGVVYDVTVPKAMKAAKEARAELRTLRTSLEKTRKAIKAPALERCRLIDDEAKRITAELVALEEPIDVQIKAEEARVEAEKLARLEAERQRVEAIARAIEDIRNVPAGLMGKPAVIIEGQLAKLRDQALDPDFFAERHREAEDALAATISRIEQQLQAQRDHEDEQKRIAAERAELERMRAENERLRREAEERAAAERAEADRLAREQREIEAARVQRIRDQITELSFVAPAANWDSGRIDAYIAERNKLDPRDADNEFDFSEWHGEACDAFDKSNSHLHEMRRAAVQREHEEYEAAEHRAEEERRLQDERAALEAKQELLAREAAALAKERAEAAAKAEADRLAGLTLRTAAQAVVDYFDGEANHASTPQVVVDLAIALDNEARAVTVNRGKKVAA